MFNYSAIWLKKLFSLTENLNRFNNIEKIKRKWSLELMRKSCFTTQDTNGWILNCSNQYFSFLIPYGKSQDLPKNLMRSLRLNFKFIEDKKAMRLMILRIRFWPDLIDMMTEQFIIEWKCLWRQEKWTNQITKIRTISWKQLFDWFFFDLNFTQRKRREELGSKKVAFKNGAWDLFGL